MLMFFTGCMVMVLVGLFMVLRSLSLKGCLYPMSYLLYGALVMAVVLALLNGWVRF